MKYLIYVFIFLFITALIFWFIGWTTVNRIDNPDESKKITFTSAMVKVHFWNSTYGDSDKVSKHVVFSKERYLQLKRYMEDASVTEIDTCEVFTVLHKYSINRHGFLESAFKPSNMRFITVLSSAGTVLVVREIIYEGYATTYNSTDVNRDCLRS